MSVQELQDTVRALEAKLKMMELQQMDGKTPAVMAGPGMSEVMSVALKLQATRTGLRCGFILHRPNSG